jgi:ABC-type tungstate transport system permease subunit
VSPDGQKAIADYKINGEQLFFTQSDKIKAQSVVD